MRRKRRFERVDEDEEVLLDESEHIEDDIELAGESEERVEDEEAEVVGKPEGDPVAAYIYGVSDKPPSEIGLWNFPWLIHEFKKAIALGDEKRAKRVADLVFRFCPAKPHSCPLYTVKETCIYGMEKRCKPRAWRGTKG